MRMAGGVLGIVVGVIMFVRAGLAVLDTEELMTGELALRAQERQVEEMRNTAGVTEEQLAAAEEALEATRAAYQSGFITFAWSLVEVVGGVVVLILGVAICVSRSAVPGILMGVVALVLMAFAIMWWPGLFDPVLVLVVLLAGIIAHRGARQARMAPAT
jgi:hypothetical protein